jgi:hypothetical protein
MRHQVTAASVILTMVGGGGVKSPTPRAPRPRSSQIFTRAKWRRFCGVLAVAGRKRKPDAVKELAGTAQKCRLNPAMPVASTNLPVPPDRSY